MKMNVEMEGIKLTTFVIDIPGEEGRKFLTHVANVLKESPEITLIRLETTKIDIETVVVKQKTAPPKPAEVSSPGFWRRTFSWR